MPSTSLIAGWNRSSPTAVSIKTAKPNRQRPKPNRADRPLGPPPYWPAAKPAATQHADKDSTAQRQSAPIAPPPSQDLTALEAQLRNLTHQIASLHQPYESAFAALRSDLAEVNRALTEAVPRQAIEALE